MDKPLFILSGIIQSPPFSRVARLEAGFLLRELQQGALLDMPHSRPMPSIAGGVHELRIRDAQHNWRIVYYLDTDAVVILEIFDKKTRQTPQSVLENCQSRLKIYQDAAKENE